MDKTTKNWKQELAEYGELHNEDCCVNTEYGCDVGVGDVECCENMKAIASFFSEQTEIIIDFISHDMDFKDEEQRKEAVKMYLKHFGLINNSNKSMNKETKNTYIPPTDEELREDHVKGDDLEED